MSTKLARQLKRRIKRSVERLFGITIYGTPSVHGREILHDIKTSGCQIRSVFDVGANIGQSTEKFRTAFPEARIYCFEPVGCIFEQLKENVGSDERIALYQVALGSTCGESTIYVTDNATTSTLVKTGDFKRLEKVVVRTVDDVVAETKESRIDVLKVDAEGFDLEVLKGADLVLSSRLVSFVVIEVGFHPGAKWLVLFDVVRAFLMSREFKVFGVYDQTLEWSGAKSLRFANVCFSNEAAFRNY